MKLTKDTEEKIEQLQVLERNLQTTLIQKQTFQSQLLEIESSLEELDKNKGVVYKIVGPIMISSNKPELEKDLKSKKEIVELRLKNLDKQEKLIRDKAKQMQSDVMDVLKEKRG